MLQILVLGLLLLCAGLAWTIYRLINERANGFALQETVERAMYEAGWFKAYEEARFTATRTLADERKRKADI